MFLPAGSCTEVLTLLWGTQHLWNSPPIANSRVWAVAAGLKKNIPVPSTVWSWWLCWWAAPEALLLFRRVFFFFFFCPPFSQGSCWDWAEGLASNIWAAELPAALPSQLLPPTRPAPRCCLANRRHQTSLVPSLHWTISLFFLSKGCCLLRHWICVGVSVCQN